MRFAHEYVLFAGEIYEIELYGRAARLRASVQSAPGELNNFEVS